MWHGGEAKPLHHLCASMQLSSVKAVQALYSALGGLRKAGKAHIRMRVMNAFEPVAQSVEHVTFNHGVRGSNPRGLANKNKDLSPI